MASAPPSTAQDVEALTQRVDSLGQAVAFLLADYGRHRFVDGVYVGIGVGLGLLLIGSGVFALAAIFQALVL